MPMRANRVIAALLLVLIGALLSACGQTDDSAETAAVTRETVLRVGVPGFPREFGNPFSAFGQPNGFTWSALFDSLTHVTRDGEIEPALATSWTALDENTWRFTLRDDVIFHNGKQLTAADVVWTVNYMTDMDAANASIAKEVEALESATAIDPLTVEIKTRYPAPLLPATLSVMPIVDGAVWDEIGRAAYAADPIGTGPFRLESRESGSATLVAHRESWRPPQIDRVELLDLPLTSARVQAFQAGAIDIAINLDADAGASIEAAGGRIALAPTVSTLAVSFTLTDLAEDHPLSDIRVRRALNHAINREEYIATILAGITNPSTQPVAPAAFGYDPSLESFAYDPDLARSLLTEAGYPDGFPLTIEAVVGISGQDAPVYQQVAADLRAIGIDATVRSITFPELLRRVIGATEWQGEGFGMNYNPDRTLDALRIATLHSCEWHNAWFCDEALYQQVLDARATWDIEERRAKTQAIMKAYRDAVPSIWLHELVYMHGVAAHVVDFDEHLGMIAYERIRLVDGS